MVHCFKFPLNYILHSLKHIFFSFILLHVFNEFKDNNWKISGPLHTETLRSVSNSKPVQKLLCILNRKYIYLFDGSLIYKTNRFMFSVKNISGLIITETMFRSKLTFTVIMKRGLKLNSNWCSWKSDVSPSNLFKRLSIGWTIDWMDGNLTDTRN